MAASQNRFALELNEKDVIEILENATPGSTKKATKLEWKYFQVKTWKLYFDNLKHPWQSKQNNASWDNIYKLIKLISYTSPTFSDWLLTHGNK